MSMRRREFLMAAGAGVVAGPQLVSATVRGANERLNITPDTIRGSNKKLLAYVSPRYYAAFKKQLESDARSIQKGKISAAFYPKQMITDAKALEVVITGNLKRWVGARLIGEDSKSYRLSFSRSGYLLLLTSFKEVE